MEKMADKDKPEHDPYQCARAWVALREVHSRVSEALTDALANECGLTVNDFEVLVHLQAAAPDRVRLGDLGDVVPLSQPALSRLVMRLEQRGLVARYDTERDRRAVLIELTDAGRAVLECAIPIHAESIGTHLTDRMSSVEQETLLAIFARLQQELPRSS